MLIPIKIMIYLALLFKTRKRKTMIKKNTIKIAPIFIILSMFSTFSHTKPLSVDDKTIDEPEENPMKICKDYPFCKLSTGQQKTIVIEKNE
jgi:hypothetical protein